MIQVLLLILKIIGLTILAILGLIVLVLALVLFVPVFYRVRIIHGPNNMKVSARASFLFPMLLVTFQYLKKISYKVRVFGFALLDSDKPKKEKKSKKEKKRVKKQKKMVAEVVPEPTGAVVQVQEEHPKTETIEEPAQEKEEHLWTEAPDSSPQPEEKKGFFEKIKGKIKKTRETISNVVSKIKRFLYLKKEVKRILAKPETKEAFGFAWDKLKRLLKHIFPRKIKGYVVYGADNPATTGQVLGILSVICAKTGKVLEIRPNFEEKQLECDVELKGRIQVFTLLVIAVKVFLNKELRQLFEEFKSLKEIE